MFGQKRKYQINAEMHGKRADLAISLMETEVSRQYLQKLFDIGKIHLMGKTIKRSCKVKDGDILEVDFPESVKLEIEPVNIPIDIVYEDEYLLVVNKKAGMVVHPSETGEHIGKSLVNAIMFHVGDTLKGIGGVLRPGIVHRLDKDTSGLVIIAKTDPTHRALVEMFKKRKIEKYYYALVYNNISEDEGLIEADIGRDRHDRKRMAIDGVAPRNAKTQFEVLDRFNTNMGNLAFIRVKLHTGRTHQIRVHFKSIRNPLIGDSLYGDRKVNKYFAQKYSLNRQFLHAFMLRFVHPETSKKVALEIGLPEDLEKIIRDLTKN